MRNRSIQWCESKIVEVLGKEVEHYTTKKLPKEEFSHYLNSVDAYCSCELGIMLPIPQELQMRG